MSLKDADILELKDRYEHLIPEYAELALELAPKLEQFGRYKRELELLTVEFVKRGFTVEDPESLKRLIEEEIKKRNQEVDVERSNQDST